MAVASMWAAGSLKLESYYVLREDLNPGLKSYLVEIATPKFTRFSVSAKNPDHQEILNVLNEETFSWEGLPESKPGKEPVNIDEKIKNSDLQMKIQQLTKCEIKIEELEDSNENLKQSTKDLFIFAGIFDQRPTFSLDSL